MSAAPMNGGPSEPISQREAVTWLTLFTIVPGKTKLLASVPCVDASPIAQNADEIFVVSIERASAMSLLGLATVPTVASDMSRSSDFPCGVMRRSSTIGIEYHGSLSLASLRRTAYRVGSDSECSIRAIGVRYFDNTGVAAQRSGLGQISGAGGVCPLAHPLRPGAGELTLLPGGFALRVDRASGPMTRVSCCQKS